MNEIHGNTPRDLGKPFFEFLPKWKITVPMSGPVPEERNEPAKWRRVRVVPLDTQRGPEALHAYIPGTAVVVPLVDGPLSLPARALGERLDSQDESLQFGTGEHDLNGVVPIFEEHPEEPVAPALKDTGLQRGDGTNDDLGHDGSSVEDREPSL